MIAEIHASSEARRSNAALVEHSSTLQPGWNASITVAAIYDRQLGALFPSQQDRFPDKDQMRDPGKQCDSGGDQQR
jgi:hypothetical protein